MANERKKYHDISWHFCHTINKIILVAKARNYGIFVAKFYDYSVIDSFWWPAGFSDSAASSATPPDCLPSKSSHYPPVPSCHPKFLSLPNPIPSQSKNLLPVSYQSSVTVRPWWLPHVCLPQHSRLCQLCVGWFLPTSTYELVPVPFPKVLEHFYNSLRSYTHGLKTFMVFHRKTQT